MVMRTALLIFLSFVARGGACETAKPDLSRFTVAVSGTRTSKVKIISRQDHQYRTALRQADLHKPNFACHYVIVEIGCGTSCVLAGAIDTRDGHVSWLPFTITGPANAPLNWRPLSYRPDSTLLVVDGARDEHGGGKHFYEFRYGRFVQVGRED